ncbi:Exodeoxyribonuclease 7 large subunit [uncultured Roseburia sp.]|uniref:Exodeoxyribonuclease 7 large subunit n=1 Tax=Brotonthovivens ammoniilytica TaxID=2981725 RepID=A0ABT2TFT2_9FIRM|nr:exodeoxyribonuclease VII large subunit [Brotonthovivens ammoniilytica]MCU6761001.1 exodeoxyribonuclease VII large subunit [Brotonthovivens ammoniilytica]SCI15942.1 Exodeoxyribonuclease 7 large subunit [uncultured Roseburia sp.]
MTKNIYSVKQVNTYIKNMFAQDFMMNHIYVRGEISNCKYHTSGHIYFTMKDETGTLSAVMFSGSRKMGLGFRMKEGDKVVVLGAVRVYERDGKYQLYAESIILEGAGLLYQKYEQLKQELEEMGMFAEEYKQPIPSYPRTVGVVTAPTGAAVRDIQNIASRRNPCVQLVLYPAQVQGEGAAQSIVKGIRALEDYGVDVMIVGRGGGSIEDLWAFNEEIVARAIFECRVPIISAVGHETDTTIADYAADLRAPTPSAAAELAVFDLRGILAELDTKKMHLNCAMVRRLEQTAGILEQYRTRLNYYNPQNQLQEKRQICDELKERLSWRMERLLKDRKHKLQMYASLLDGLSPLKKISGGCALVTDRNGRLIQTVGELQPGDQIALRMKDGEASAQITERSVTNE